MLFVAVTLVGLLCAAATRRWSPAGQQLSVAATTLLAVVAATAAGLTVMESTSGPWRPWLTLAVAALSALAVVHLGAWVNRRAIDPVRRRRTDDDSQPDALTRIEEWTEQHPARVGGVNLLAVALGASRRTVDVRVTGLAAEMTYYGLISLVPLLTALGASLGFLERVLDTEQVAQIEETLVDQIAAVFAEQVAQDVLAPLVENLLREERAGVAIGSVVVALWLASRMFRAAIRALDDAYAVPERRGFLGQRILGLALSLGAVITLVVLLAMVVVGPLLGSGQEIADRLGLGAVFEITWAVLRWPAVAAVCATYLTILYRYGPNTDTPWTRCLPGSLVGTVGLVAVAVGFGVYLRLAGPTAPAVEEAQGAAVTAAAQMIGVVLAGVLWLWLSSIVILVGGVLNAELDCERGNAEDDTGTKAEPATL